MFSMLTYIVVRTLKWFIANKFKRFANIEMHWHACEIQVEYKHGYSEQNCILNYFKWHNLWTKIICNRKKVVNDTVPSKKKCWMLIYHSTTFAHINIYWICYNWPTDYWFVRNKRGQSSLSIQMIFDHILDSNASLLCECFLHFDRQESL